MSSKQVFVPINSKGVVTNSGVHDGTITEVNLCLKGKTQNGTIRFISEDGINFLILLEGITFANIDYLATQNVINDLFIFKGIDASEHIMKIVGLEENSFYGYQELCDRIKNGDLTLVKVVPSIGAEITCVCQAATIYTE